ALPGDLGRAAAQVPFSIDELRAARENGEMLVFRLARDAKGPLTIERLIEVFAHAFEPKLLTKVGYTLRDEWGILLEPLAKTETCAVGWHLAHKAPVAATCNLSYYEQQAALHKRGHSVERRRTAVEATLDVVLYQACRGERLLQQSFDWTSSRTVDGGYLCV